MNRKEVEVWKEKMRDLVVEYKERRASEFARTGVKYKPPPHLSGLTIIKEKEEGVDANKIFEALDMVNGESGAATLDDVMWELKGYAKIIADTDREVGRKRHEFRKFQESSVEAFHVLADEIRERNERDERMEKNKGRP
jgi:hypothetical protein